MMDETSVGPYYATADLITLENDVMMAEAYVVAMIMPQDAEEDEEEYNDDIDDLFVKDDDIDVLVTTDDQAALVASFETTHSEEETC
jgi:hypothetical protein